MVGTRGAIRAFIAWHSIDMEVSEMLISETLSKVYGLVASDLFRPKT